MADSYTQVSSLDLSQTAYDRMAYFALRPELYFDQCADVKPTNQSMNGATVQFTIFADLAIAVTPLSETTDVSAVSMSDSTVSLTLAEYGNAVVTTAKLRGTSFLDLDPIVANVVGYNAGVSLDTIARAKIDSATNVMYASGLGATALGSVTARVNIIAGTTISSLDVRVARARLRAQNVGTFGGMYVGYVHPDIVADLQGESLSNTQSLGWRAPHVYSQPNEIWTGELGSFEGVRFIETPRAPVYQGGGSASATNVYGTIILGRQSLAKAHSISDGNAAYPHIIPGPITDHLRRLVPLGWYWLGAYGVFRQAALMRIESSSLLGSDISTTIGTGTAYEPAIDLGETGNPPV